METRHSGDEMEIDLREIFFALKKKIWWILATGLLLGCAAGAYSQIFIEPTYTSTSSMLVLSKEETLSSMSDLVRLFWKPKLEGSGALYQKTSLRKLI